MNFQTEKITKNFAVALILLSAIFSGTIFSASTQSRETAEMVYCPLTKQLQPVHAIRKSSLKNPLNEICGSETEKNQFSNEVVKKISLGFSIASEKQFEDLVFDYFRAGKSAFNTTQHLPAPPENKLIKNSFSLTGFGNNFSSQIVWKSEERFAFQLKPRPPTAVSQAHFEIALTKDLSAISRNINPRSPPFSV